mmetsp:Transcript_50583/g.50950  ORF Transcript_50583/g.50950 Transcript_50583/m.50950 type:complete len:91 (-) Transcript_50583:203-475(-)
MSVTTLNNRPLVSSDHELVKSSNRTSMLSSLCSCSIVDVTVLVKFVGIDVAGCMLGDRVGMNVVGIWMERMCVARRVCWSVGFCKAEYDA